MTGLTATAASSSQITLAWTASTDSGGSGLAGYRVERCQGAGCTTFVQIATPSTNSYSDTGLTAGTSYSYRVRAVDGAGNLSLNYSNTASATPSAVTNLVTAYGMNEGSGTTLADASGSGHTGTLVNGPAWVAGQATYGQALSFDGLDDAVSVANPATYNFGTADFTIELWAKRNVLGGAQRHLFSKCHSTTWQSGCKELYFNPSNQLTFGSFATGDTVSSTIADTNWHHIAVTFTDSTNTLQIYVDGALATTATKALEADGAGHVVTLGNLLGSNPFSGLLDDVRIYSRVLTLAEIQADRATPITPPGPDTTPPSDVTGLTATAVSPTQINLSWAAATDNVGVTGYRVERCQGAGCTSFVADRHARRHHVRRHGPDRLHQLQLPREGRRCGHECECELLDRGQRHHPGATARHDSPDRSDRPDRDGGQQQSDHSGLDRLHRQRRERLGRLPGRALSGGRLHHLCADRHPQHQQL